MPECAVHYQFGQEVLSRLDEDLKGCVLEYKDEYDIGLQGPDIFFYHKPYIKNEIADYGHGHHDRPGIQMFGPILSKVREKASLAYMLGLICHYSLDVSCHPYVYKHCPGSIEHFLMEAAFGRHILMKYGLKSERYRLVSDSGLDFEAMALLWPGMSPKTVRNSIKSMHFYTWLLDHKSVLQIIEKAAGNKDRFSSMSLPGVIPKDQQIHVQRLEELYMAAIEECIARIRKACAIMGTDAVPEGFEKNYKGEAEHEQTGEEPDTL